MSLAPSLFLITIFAAIGLSACGRADEKTSGAPPHSFGVKHSNGSDLAAFCTRSESDGGRLEIAIYAGENAQMLARKTWVDTTGTGYGMSTHELWHALAIVYDDATATSRVLIIDPAVATPGFASGQTALDIDFERGAGSFFDPTRQVVEDGLVCRRERASQL